MNEEVKRWLLPLGDTLTLFSYDLLDTLQRRVGAESRFKGRFGRGDILH